jgi:predicted RNase H-like nuclease
METVRYRVVGLDIGYSLSEPTSGLLLAEIRDRVLFPIEGPFNLMQDRAHEAAREFCKGSEIKAVAVDAPLASTYQTDYRPVEAVFSRRKFQKHCKPGSTASSVGQDLHAAGMAMVDALKGVASYVAMSDLLNPPVAPILEVFPNAALGVLVASSDVPIRSGGSVESNKSDVFFDVIRTKHSGRIGCITLHPSLYIKNHDQRMAVICAALAACFAEQEFAVVGEDASGYFLMPHIATWNKTWSEELKLTMQTVPQARLLSVPVQTDAPNWPESS